MSDVDWEQLNMDSLDLESDTEIKLLFSAGEGISWVSEV